MNTINLKVEDDFYHLFKELIMDDIKEVKQSVYASEKTVGINQKEYQKEMDSFFKSELGIIR